MKICACVAEYNPLHLGHLKHIDYMKTDISPKTARLAAGYDAVCLFVASDANREVISALAKENVKLLLLRCAGFNNVDLAAAKEFYAQTGATLLLKGHRSLIVGAEGCFENRCGNPGMATGGSGDVLAGIVTALLGQGLSPTRAAAAAA